MKDKKKKRTKKILIGLSVLLVVAGVAAVVSISYFVGFPKVVGDKKYSYNTEVIYVKYDDVVLYGKALIPVAEEKDTFPTVIYAHGAESSHSSDMTTLKSLAMSGIAVYTFDFYGWSDKSTGPDGEGTFMRGGDYESRVLEQSEDLSAVIDAVRELEFVDNENLFLLGSSMGGCVSAVTVLEHNDDIRGLILQYPAINLRPDAMVTDSKYDAAKYTGNVLILQGTDDTIVPLSMSEELTDHYNTTREDHAELIIYEGQPHVFNGKYKVQAAKDTYKFIKEIIDDNE
jgi:dipeptidyl aminopeptidase/acylaminoacyl peptidase